MRNLVRDQQLAGVGINERLKRAHLIASFNAKRSRANIPIYSWYCLTQSLASIFRRCCASWLVSIASVRSSSTGAYALFGLFERTKGKNGSTSHGFLTFVDTSGKPPLLLIEKPISAPN
jgi:hypothetical protein